MKGYWECNKGVKTKQQGKKDRKTEKRKMGGGEKGEGKMTKEKERGTKEMEEVEKR